MNLKGSKTEKNLKDAFAGESQANRRYLYFAAKADVEGYNDVSTVFRSTAEGETGHAHGHLEYLEAVGDPATGLPIGMFCQERYSSTQIKLGKGDRLLLYTDGLSEARDQHAREYGDDRMPTLLGECHALPAIALVNRLLDDVSQFSSARPRADDLTVMAIEMVGH